MDPLTQRLTAAMQLHEAGRLGEAEALYRGILAEAPQQPHALHLLGLVLYQQGQHAPAAELITQALALHGPHPVFHSNLAAVYLELNRLDDTVAHARAALQMDPGLANAHNNLGVALMRQGHYDDAIPAFAEAVRLQPRHIDARCNLAAALHRQGRLPEALRCLQQAVRLAPQHAQVQNDLGGLLLVLDQPEQAVAHLQEALRLKPSFAEAYSNLGLARRDLGQLDEALACFRTSVRLNPRYTGAHNNLAHTLESTGQLAAARAELDASLALDPDNPRALAGLSSLAAAGHGELSAEQGERIGRLVTRTDLPLDDRGRLHFALARLLDKEQRYDEAFAHYREGNELRKRYVKVRGATFDPAAHRRLIDRLIAGCTPASIERMRGFGSASKLPIYIVGMMRSGTTLAEQILASHPFVHGAGELRDLDVLTTHLAQRLGSAADYPECLTQLDAPTARRLAEELVQGLQARDPKAQRVVDKMPFNYLHLGLIAMLLPQATLVHCRRDPVDTCLSCYMQNFGEPQSFTLDLADLGFYYRQYERLMAHWQAVLPRPIYELSYEALTAEPETQTRRLLEQCGLPFDERCLRFHETARPVRTASMLQVRQPMYRSAVGRWKRYEKHLAPLLDALQNDQPV